ncbi:hypothetical protein BGX38DRAFT_1251630 [Terfezia claveryi]|nr:hypothetical protein BGX38DRAFT_1251630 [Terfezia claveryi]
MPIDRSLGRNVQFYDAISSDVALGGMIQNGSVTEGKFLDILGILFITETPIRVQERSLGHIVMKTNTRLENGGFATEIRARDGRCVISKVVNTQQGSLYRYGRWITDTDDTNGVLRINSLQNVMLLREHIHSMLGGRVLDPVCREPNNVHHKNMRGAGVPIFEHDFSRGNMIGVISKEPYAKERLESG